MADTKKKKQGLKSTQVWKYRRANRNRDEQLKQRKLEMALKTELTHKLDVQFASNEAVEIEVAENALASFLVLLDDPEITSLYTFEQVDDSLFVFRPNSIL